ncbi:DUF3311 domain-containing protein [Actinospica robiniae]|uniref:DUF3311 domain-containing protein n=1 Tax=Actinospica robiniae TaxID=304901 RepID=UPI00041DD745|nr:DUF3311 domain-containing protein [Actinospica robiniae]
MSGGSTPYKVISPLRLFATFCVLAPTVAVIAVPTYDSATPRLGGFPFYYWYQLLWVVLTGVLMVAAFWAIKLDEGKRRQARAAAGTPESPTGPEMPGSAGPDADGDEGVAGV